MMDSDEPTREAPALHIGICGAGLGGLLAAIALADAGARVTVLEAASDLSEIGAGIQMTPNVARLLQKFGVDKVIGENLVRFEELNLRRQDGTPVGYTPIRRIEDTIGHPWWLVHRHHLHQGLVVVAGARGVEIRIKSRVVELEYQKTQRVTVVVERGEKYVFDLLVGADGVGSICRKILFPDVSPCPPTTNCAYRAIVPTALVEADPAACELVQKRTMEVWMSERRYIISYPISNGRDFNMVLSHHRSKPVSTVEDIDMNDLYNEYDDFDPRIARVVRMVTEAQRWPLVVTGPLPSWSSPRKNVVLMGDAAHSMTNHMAQGAATSMEDGAFLGRCVHAVVQGKMRLMDAVMLYEQERMPRARHKQEVSFLNGEIWQSGGEAQEARDRAMAPELAGETLLRSPNLYGDPSTVLAVYGYDAEAHADTAIEAFLREAKEVIVGPSSVTQMNADRYMNWYLPVEQRM